MNMQSPTGSSATESNRVEPEWTLRQREVLALLVRGRTNGQIADELGVSLGGAKWHVSEIITKLGVDSREEAAEYWRVHNGLRLRFTRALRSLTPGAAWAKIAIGAAAIIASGVIVVFGVGLYANGGRSCADGNVQYVEAAPTSVSQPITLSLTDALARATKDAGFQVTAPCHLPAGNLVIQSVGVTHLPQSLGVYAEVSIIPADTPRENGHFMNPSPWIRIDQAEQLPDESGTTVIGTVGRSDVHYSEQKQRSPTPTDLPDSDSALYSVQGPHSWLTVSASGFPGALPPRAEMLAMLESMFH